MLVLGLRMVAVRCVDSIGLKGDARGSSGRRNSRGGVGRGGIERRQIQATLQIAKLLQETRVRLREQKQAKGERGKIEQNEQMPTKHSVAFVHAAVLCCFLR